MTNGRGGRLARGAAASVGLVAGLEVLARRIEGGLRDPLPVASEAAFKLQRLRSLNQRRHAPRVVFIGASVLNADIDPRVVDDELGVDRASFNACLTGSDLATMRRWWRLLQPEVRPEVVVVEAHPGMMLPPGTMADKLHAHLDDLTECLAQERRPARPALPAVVAAGWPRTREALHRSFRIASEPAGPAGMADARNQANGHLIVFQDVPFEVGSRQLGESNWYELVEIDLAAAWRHDEYLDFVDEVRSSVPSVLLAISPLMLEGSPATAPGAEIPAAISDATVARAPERNLDVIDLRQCVHGRDDFADPFHLRSQAVERASRAAAVAVRPMLSPG